MSDLDPFGDAAVFTPQAQAAADPFGAAPMIGDMPAAAPPKSGEGDPRQYKGMVSSLRENLSGWGRSALETAVDTVPGIFQREDLKGKDPFADPRTGVSVQDGTIKVDPGAPKTLAGAFGQALRTNPEDMANNLRTGLQRNIGADAGAAQSVADLIQRGVYYTGQGLYNTIPPLRMDAGPLLRMIGNPYALYRYHVQGDKSPMMLGPFSSGVGGPWMWNDWDGYGPTPKQSTTPYEESPFKYQHNVGYRAPVDIPSLDFGSLAQSRESAETGLPASQAGAPDAVSLKTSAVHLGTPTIDLPDMAEGMKAADALVTKAGTLFGKDWSPYEPKTPIEDVAQEVMGGLIAPGPLMMRLAMPAASALAGQIPGVKGTAFELPLRIAAGMGTGIPLTLKAGAVSPTGRVLRENTADLASGGGQSGQPFRTARQNLTSMEGYQNKMADAGISVLPGELMSLGRGDEPSLTQLTQTVAKNGQAGNMVRNMLRTRGQQTGDVLRKTMDTLLGKAPDDKYALSQGLSDAGQSHALDAAATADQARVALGGIKGAVGPEGVQSVIRSLDRALLGDREGFTTRTLQDLRGGITQPARPLRAVGADAVSGSPRVEPVTDLRTLHKLTTEWERRLAAGEVPDAARPAVESAIGDLKTHMKTASPAYAAASLDASVAAEDAARAAASPVGRIGQAAELEGANPNSALKSAHTLLLNPDNATPESLASAAKILNGHDPSLLRGAVSDWLNRSLSKAIGQGTDPRTGATFARNVFGDPDKKALLKSALENIRDDAGNPVAAHQLLDLFPALEAMDVLPNSLGKASFNVSTLPKPGLTRTVVGGLGKTIPPIRDVMERSRTARGQAAALGLDPILGSDRGITPMLDLMHRIPEARTRAMSAATAMNEGRNVARSIMFGTGGGFPPPSPLLNPDKQQ